MRGDVRKRIFSHNQIPAAMQETARNWASRKRRKEPYMVIALDKNKRPLGFITERRCRKLFEKKRAVMYHMFPMVVIIKDVDARKIENLPAFRIKIDPGSKYDGIAVIDEKANRIMFAMQIEHRAEQVKKNLDTRRGARRNRRSRETIYRKSKFADGGVFRQKGNEGTIPPSIHSIIGNTETWVKRLSRWINLENASVEAVRFDTQLLGNPDIEGKQYQHGTLAGTEIKEYLLIRHSHTCQYCGGASGDSVLEIEHMKPKSRGGSNSIRNLTISCHTCNQLKGSLTPEEWLDSLQAKAKKTDLDRARIKDIQNVINSRETGKSNRYCAWVNITRKRIESFLFGMFEDVECSSGGRTKYNRANLGYPKDHQYDAACIGNVPTDGYEDLTHGYYVYAKATGRGTRFRGKINKCGIITKKLAPRAKKVAGFMNGDIVVANIPHKEPKPYKYEGRYTGRVMTRASGSFDIRTVNGKLVTTSYKFIKKTQNADGYQYRQNRTTWNENQLSKQSAFFSAIE